MVVNKTKSLRDEAMKNFIIDDMDAKSFEQKQNLDELELQCNKFIADHSDRLVWDLFITKTNLMNIAERQIFPSINWEKRLIENVQIQNVHFDEPFQLFEMETILDSIENAKYLWKSTNVKLIFVNEKMHNIVLYTEDCQRYTFQYIKSEIAE